MDHDIRRLSIHLTTLQNFYELIDTPLAIVDFTPNHKKEIPCSQF